MYLAEAVRFELTNGCPLPVFKTGALSHSATPPSCPYYKSSSDMSRRQAGPVGSERAESRGRLRSADSSGRDVLRLRLAAASPSSRLAR
jgi:hypothetical protein